ncbi:hypothetical protein [Alteromonas sp. a30]|uniref:hypothetical protein n=1 Tax=Alteromonas sp. a30 TaxID=2730917 RepID=UPI00227F6131|nr:hypothetical protein [Alteromonas sp. a30]MCY7295098.1 hypothetical protein [Alteromonas sp. a30]
MLEHEFIEGLGYKVGSTIYANDPRDRSEWQTENMASFLAEMQQAYEEEQARLNPVLSDIVITQVSNVLKAPSDLATMDEVKVTCLQGGVFRVSGTLDIDDESFIMPVRSFDGGIAYFPAEVSAGEFQVDLQFAESGKYQITAELLNQELSTPRFAMKPISIYVLNQVASPAA